MLKLVGEGSAKLTMKSWFTPAPDYCGDGSHQSLTSDRLFDSKSKGWLDIRLNVDFFGYAHDEVSFRLSSPEDVVHAIAKDLSEQRREARDAEAQSCRKVSTLRRLRFG